MKYIKLDENKWVEIDEANNTSRIIVKSEVEDRLIRLDELIKPHPTDEQLLEWARENYPMGVETQENIKHEAEKQSLLDLLENLK